jgi:hypothetical protein
MKVIEDEDIPVLDVTDGVLGEGEERVFENTGESALVEV